MVIFYEIIYCLLYHSIAIYSFNDSVNKILPEKLQSMDVNETYVKIWFDQINVVSSNTTAVVREVSAPGINYYIGLYFIIETSLNSSSAINFLHPHIRIVNRYLSKLQTLSYIAGISYVPPLPSNWSYISESNFRAGVTPKLEDILKSHIFGAIMVVFVFNKKRDSLFSVQTDVCSAAVVYWNYDLKPGYNGKDLNDELFLEIVLLLEGCQGSCDTGANACNALEDYPVKNLSAEEIQCLATTIQTNEASCTKKPPEEVFVPVCGNGIIEHNENCDCLDPLDCGSKCDAHCNLKQKARGGTNRFFIIAVAASIIASIIFALSLVLFLYFKHRNSLESRSLGIAIPHGGFKTELNIPNQYKLDDWTLPYSIAEATIRNPSKSKLDLGIKIIGSSGRSKSKTDAMSKEILKPKSLISNDQLQSKTNAMSFERLTPKKIASKERTKSKTNASSKSRLISKKISNTKVIKSKSAVDLAKSIQPKKTSSSKSVSKASLSINLKTVASKSLPQSKTLKNDLKRNSFK